MRNTVFIIFSLIFILSINNIQGQALGDSLLPGKGEKSSDDSETIITSDKMDINLPKNIITLRSNVKIKDSKNKIQADKVIVYLKENDKKGDDKSSQSDSNIASSSENVKKIIAKGNVVFTKSPPSKEDKKTKKQQAIAGKANYNVENGKLILTKDPKLIQGDSFIAGSKITLWRDSDRMLVEGKQKGGDVSTLVISPKQEKRLSN